jgi:hypothetical protein
VQDTNVSNAEADPRNLRRCDVGKDGRVTGVESGPAQRETEFVDPVRLQPLAVHAPLGGSRDCMAPVERLLGLE